MKKSILMMMLLLMPLCGWAQDNSGGDEGLQSSNLSKEQIKAILASGEVSRDWTWNNYNSPNGTLWGSMGYCGGNGADVGTSGSGQWWGVHSEEEFKEQYSQAKDKTLLGDESLTAFMTFGSDGTIVRHAGDGSVISSGVYDIEVVENNPWKVANLHTTAGSILWPYEINSGGNMPTVFEVVYLTNDELTLVYPGGGNFESLGSWGEATYWHFASKEMIEEHADDLHVGSMFTAPTPEGVEMTFKVTDVRSRQCQVGDGENTAINKGYSGAITIPAEVNGFKVTTVASWALYECSISSLILPEGIVSLQSNSIENCDAITSMVLPASVNWMDVTFGGFGSNLLSITVAPGNQVYDSRNNCNAIIETSTNILRCGCARTVIPESVTGIGDWSMHKRNVETLKIPKSVKTIGVGAFRYNNFTELSIPESVELVGDLAFEGCSSLEKVWIHKSCRVGQRAFSYCGNLKKVVSCIETPVVEHLLEGWNFSDTHIFISDYDGDLGTESLRDDAVLYVPTGTKSLYEANEGWNNFSKIVESVTSENAVYVPKENNSLVIGDMEETVKIVDIPSNASVGSESHSVTAIAENAFENNKVMELVCIPETVEEIGDAAFAGCSNLSAIYSYAAEPISLGSDHAQVRTRADDGETAASAVFAEVDKETCVLYVPKGSGDKYRHADGWGEFLNIVEIESSELGDANNDGEVSADDINAISSYIVRGDTKNFIFKNADVNGDKMVNAADIVNIVNMNK